MSIVTSKDEPTDVQLDISKYEGHTPGPWTYRGPQGLDLENETQAVVVLYDDPRMRWGGEADMKLIADAPLLLEGVKRLQHKLMLAESALGEIRAYHERGQGNLGEIIEHYQENEQVEMPNAFDED